MASNLDIAALRVFLQVAELAHFSRAADELGLPKGRVSQVVRELESRLGTRLFQRTTRRVALTQEGLHYLGRCRDVLGAVADADASLVDVAQTPRGQLTITAPVLLGQHAVADFLSRFVRANPQIRCSALLLDRYVNLVEEGVDVGIRIGALDDSSLVALKLGEVRHVVVASPPFLRRHGTPRHPGTLREHACVRLAGPAKPGWAFQDAGRKLHVAVNGPLDFNHAGAALRACENGLGFGQFFSYQVQDALKARRLRVVLDEFEPARLPVNVVYPHARLLPARTRAFIDAARRELAPMFAA